MNGDSAVTNLLKRMKWDTPKSEFLLIKGDSARQQRLTGQNDTPA